MLFRRFCAFAVIAMVAAPSTSQATAFDSLEALSQDDFEVLTENLGAATHFRSITPTEPLGIVGVDIGISITATEIDDDILDLASEGDFDLSQVFVPKLHLNKGLPFGFDIGAFASAIPETGITLFGGEVRYAIFDGSAVTPSVGVRAAFSTLQGLDQLDLNNFSLDISISKGVLFLTPYAGLGFVVTEADASDEFGFDSETVTQEKVYVGLNLNFGVNWTFEADRTGDFTSFSVKGGIRF